jgi:hypothetical protein
MASPALNREAMEGDSLQVLFSRLVVFRSTPFGMNAWSAVGKPAGYAGRFHRLGEPLPLYASESEQASLRELDLHTELPLEPAREVLRRVTAIAIPAGARVLLADHVDTLEATGLTLEQVYDPSDYKACQLVADYARSLSGSVAVSTQSNADRQQRTLAVLPEHARMTALVDYWEGSLNLLRLGLGEREAAAQPSG